MAEVLVRVRSSARLAPRDGKRKQNEETAQLMAGVDKCGSSSHPLRWFLSPFRKAQWHKLMIDDDWRLLDQKAIDRTERPANV